MHLGQSSAAALLAFTSIIPHMFLSSCRPLYVPYCKILLQRSLMLQSVVVMFVTCLVERKKKCNSNAFYEDISCNDVASIELNKFKMHLHYAYPRSMGNQSFTGCGLCVAKSKGPFAMLGEAFGSACLYSHYVCVCVCACTCLTVSVCLCACLPACLPACLRAYVCACVCAACLGVCVCVCLCLSVCLFVPSTQTCLPTWHQVHFLRIFEGKGLSLARSLSTPCESTSQREICNTNVPSQGWYHVRFFGLSFGAFGASERDKGCTWYGNSAKPKRTSQKASLENPDAALRLSTRDCTWGFLFARFNSKAFLIIPVADYDDSSKPTHVMQCLCALSLCDCKQFRVPEEASDYHNGCHILFHTCFEGRSSIRIAQLSILSVKIKTAVGTPLSCLLPYPTRVLLRSSGQSQRWRSLQLHIWGGH